MMKVETLPSGIRRATADDAVDIRPLYTMVHELHNSAYPHLFRPLHDELFSPAKIQELIADPDHVFFLAEEGEEIAGYLYMEIRRRPETPHMHAREEIHIHHLSVKPAYRRRGHATRLMVAAKGLMQTLNIPTLTLVTWAFTHDAQAFFEQCGFAPMYHQMWMRESA